MKKRILKLTGLFVVMILMVSGASYRAAYAGTAEGIDGDVDSALQKLYDSVPSAKELSKVAKGILVFPNIVKGGLIIGGQYGEGALRIGGKTTGYYNSTAVSDGLIKGGLKL